MSEATVAKTKALFKILIGAAWIDGEIQPEEREILRSMATEQNLADDPEIRPFLYELVQVQPEQCYQWIEAYLGRNPSHEDCQSLLEAISLLVYSDGSVEVEEARLLSRIQEIDLRSGQGEFSPAGVLKSIQQLYRAVVSEK
ncbi:MAG: TerB family tellurite resistance protein [Prochlorothrix sp.]|nr:TerB family tellurite resistance protein [Prochlorothrix sp.]